jgi:hypothetical protein
MVSPYLLRRRRSLEEALSDRLRQGRPVPAGLDPQQETPAAASRGDDALPALRLVSRQPDSSR